MQGTWRIVIACLTVVILFLAALEVQASSSTLSRMVTVDIPSEKSLRHSSICRIRRASRF